MTYSQKANPNATNSEMDSKTILKPINLTNDQFGELVQQFVELQVDNLDTKTMMEWITDELIYQYGKLSNEELKERVDCFNEELYDELVDNIVSDDEEKEIQRLMEDTTDDIIVIDSPNSPLFP